MHKSYYREKSGGPKEKKCKTWRTGLQTGYAPLYEKKSLRDPCSTLEHQTWPNNQSQHDLLYGGVSLSISLNLKLAPVPYATPKWPIYILKLLSTAISRKVLEKVHATIPKGIVGGFEFTVLQRNLK